MVERQERRKYDWEFKEGAGRAIKLEGEALCEDIFYFRLYW